MSIVSRKNEGRADDARYQKRKKNEIRPDTVLRGNYASI